MESVESCIAKSMMGSKEPRAFRLEPWTSPALEDLLPQLSLDEQLRLQGRRRERERKLKRMKSYPPDPSMLTERVCPVCQKHPLHLSLKRLPY
jgi:hypothetical protein